MNSVNRDLPERGSARDRLVLREHQLTTQEFISYFASLDTTWTILDISCGDGFYLEILRHLGFDQIYGMDEDPSLVAIARKKGLRAFEGSVYDLEAHEQLDAVIMCDQLDRLENPGLAVTRIYHALKKEGIFYLTVPVVEHLPSRFWSKVMKLWSRYEPEEKPGTHTTDSVCWLLRSHQFEVTAYARTVARTDEEAGFSDEWLSIVARKPLQPNPGLTPSRDRSSPAMSEHELPAEATEDAPTVIEDSRRS